MPYSYEELPIVFEFLGALEVRVSTFRLWLQSSSQKKKILLALVILQKKVVRIINFQPRDSHTSPLFKQNFILKFQDKICFENILFLFASKSLNNLTTSVFRLK